MLQLIKKFGIIILILDKTIFRTRKTIKDKVRPYIIKRVNPQGRHNNPTMYAPRNRASKDMKQSIEA